MQCWINIKRIQKEQTSVKLGSHKIFYETHLQYRLQITHINTLRKHFYSHLKLLLSGEPDYFGRKKISSGGDLSHYSSASLY